MVRGVSFASGCDRQECRVPHLNPTNVEQAYRVMDDVVEALGFRDDQHYLRTLSREGRRVLARFERLLAQMDAAAHGQA